MYREVVSQEWLTIIMILCLGVLCLARLSASLRFDHFVSLIGSSKYLKIYSRDQRFIDQFDSLLFINLVLSGSVFAFIGYNTLYEQTEFNWTLFSKILVGIGAILLIKILAERLIGSLFDIEELIDDYVFQKTNHKNYSGLLILGINAVLLYALRPSPILIYVAIALIVLVNLLGFLTAVKTYQNIIFNNFFYFILYLCALEIGPYVVLYGVLTI